MSSTSPLFHSFSKEQTSVCAKSFTPILYAPPPSALLHFDGLSMTLWSAVQTQVGRGKHDKKEKAVRVISLLKMKTLHTVMRVGRLFAAVATQAIFFTNT